MAKGLTQKQKRFCEEYLIDLNATQAYIRAGYAGGTKSAEANATRLMGNDKVRVYIDWLRETQQKRTAISADKVIEELAHIAFARMSNVVKVNNSVAEIKNFDDLEENELAAIASVKTRQTISDERETFETDIKLHSKDRALELLMKHMGLLSDLNIAQATAEKYGFKLVRIEEEDA